MRRMRRDEEDELICQVCGVSAQEIIDLSEYDSGVWLFCCFHAEEYRRYAKKQRNSLESYVYDMERFIAEAKVNFVRDKGYDTTDSFDRFVENERMGDILIAFTKYILTCKKRNQDEWMQGLILRINEICEKINEKDRFMYDQKNGEIVKKGSTGSTTYG